MSSLSSGNGTGTIVNLGSGSDYTAFLDFLGISSIDMGFRGQGGGTYHSTFDRCVWATSGVCNTLY